MKRKPVLDDPPADKPAENAIQVALEDTPEGAESTPESKGGRPRADGMPPGLAGPTNTLNFPKPRFKLYKTDHVSKDQRPGGCFRWWEALPTWAKDRLYVYVYREHPVLLPASDDDSNYIDKISGNEPLADELDLLHRYGCGSYKLILNDTDKPGSYRTVCTVLITNLGGGQWKENDPQDRRINDSAQVDIGNPANAGYVSYLRAAGRLPEQMDSKREKETMATVEVVTAMQEQNKHLMEEVIGMAKSQGAKVDALPSGGREALEVVSHGAKLANDMVSKAAQQSNEMLEKSRAASGGGNGGEAMNLALAIVRELKGGDTEVLELRRMLMQQQQSTIDGLKGQVDRLIELQSKASTPVSPFASVTEGVSALKTLKETLDDIRGESGGGSMIGEVAEAAGAPKWLNHPVVAAGISVLGNLAQAMLMSRQQQAMQPQYYPPPPAGMPPQPQGAPQPMPQQQPMIPSPALPPQVIMGIRMILSPLLSTLTLRENGGVLAEWAIDNMGQVNYDKMAAFGPEKLVEALYAYPESANALAQFDQSAVMTLAQEFCNPQFDEGADVAGGAA